MKYEHLMGLHRFVETKKQYATYLVHIIFFEYLPTNINILYRFLEKYFSKIFTFQHNCLKQ